MDNITQPGALMLHKFERARRTVAKDGVVVVSESRVDLQQQRCTIFSVGKWVSSMTSAH